MTRPVRLAAAKIITAAAVVLAAVTVAAPAAPASASSTCYYIVNGLGFGYYLNDPGLHNIEKTTTSPNACFGFLANGKFWNGLSQYQLYVNGNTSVCLEVTYPDQDYPWVYQQPCGSNTNSKQLWVRNLQPCGTSCSYYQLINLAYAGKCCHGYGDMRTSQPPGNGKQAYQDGFNADNGSSEWELAVAG